MKAIKTIMDTPVDILTEEFYPYLSDREIMKVAGNGRKELGKCTRNGQKKAHLIKV